MAAIDFPASPTTGQLFSAANGVTYMYNGTLWLTQAGPGGGTGDFCANNSAAITGWAASTAFVLIPTNILSGNSGSYYNTSTGRWTPPAGRYSLSATYTATSGSAQQFNLSFRKNGVNIGGSQPITSAQTVPAVSYVCTPMAACVVDANGSDYFEVLASVSATGGSITSATITAFPLTGMQGPQGPPGQLGFRLLQRTVVSSAVAAVEIISIPSDINDIQIMFDLTPSVADKILQMRFYDGAGALNTSTNYRWAMAMIQNVATFGSAPSLYTSSSSGIISCINMHWWGAGNGVGIVSGIRGDCSIYNIRDATRFKTANIRTSHHNDGVTAFNGSTGHGTYGGALALTGVRLFFDTGNIASGAFSVWGSP